jgi:hypothetical protein
MILFLTGSGCIAALEAERFLAEQEDDVAETPIEAGKKESGVIVPLL